MKQVYTFEDLKHWSSATADEPTPIRLAVFGDPVAHSASPPMHNAALDFLQIPARYTRVLIHANELRAALRQLPAAGFLGANLTIPHKAAAAGILHEVDDSARRIGAVNTVRVEGQKLIGFNTDGIGFSRAIADAFSTPLGELRVLLLGAGGGAGRAIAMQCVTEKCPNLFLVNRSFEKARALADELGKNRNVEAVGWIEETISRKIPGVDLIVNATPIGMHEDDPPLLPKSLLSDRLLIYDAVYRPNPTRFLRDASACGAKTSDGLSMLVFQGATSLELWFHRPAPVEKMREAAQQHLHGTGT
jgi:shikimate dehydrogenase